MSSNPAFKLYDELQLRLWETRRRLTYSSYKWKLLRCYNLELHNDLHKLLLEMERLRSNIIERMNVIQPTTEDESIPYLHWADATPNQRKLIHEGVMLRGYAPQDPEPPRARERRTDMPR